MRNAALFSVVALLITVSAQNMSPTTTEQAYLDMTDAELFSHQSGGNRIGEHCYVGIGSSATTSCQYYVKAEPSATTSSDGWPRTKIDLGMGCVSSGGYCSYMASEYPLTDSERASMCTGSVEANAAAQLRHAIRNKACGSLKCTTDEVVFFHDCADDVEFLRGHTWSYWSGDTVVGDLGGFLEEDFHSHRSGVSGFTYDVSDLIEGATYNIKLGFAEMYRNNCGIGKRVMDVYVNGETFQTGIDVFKEVGCTAALVLQRDFKLSGTDKFEIQFFASVENPMVSIIEVSEVCNPDTPPPTPPAPAVALTTTAPTPEATLDPTQAPVNPTGLPTSIPTPTPTNAPIDSCYTCPEGSRSLSKACPSSFDDCICEYSGAVRNTVLERCECHPCPPNSRHARGSEYFACSGFSGCTCLYGFYRDVVNRQCVEECPTGYTPDNRDNCRKESDPPSPSVPTAAPISKAPTCFVCPAYSTRLTTCPASFDDCECGPGRFRWNNKCQCESCVVRGGGCGYHSYCGPESGWTINSAYVQKVLSGVKPTAAPTHKPKPETTVPTPKPKPETTVPVATPTNAPSGSSSLDKCECEAGRFCWNNQCICASCTIKGGGCGYHSYCGPESGWNINNPYYARPSPPAPAPITGAPITDAPSRAPTTIVAPSSTPVPICEPTSGICASTAYELQNAFYSAGAGGVVAICGGSTLSTSGGTVNVNKSSMTLCCVGQGSCVMKNDGSGRNLFVSGANFKVIGVEFVGGTATSPSDWVGGLGGNVHINSPGDVRIVGCMFKDGTADHSGGNLYVNAHTSNDSSLSVEKSVFSGGRSVESGGNLMVLSTSAVSITDSTFEDGYSETSGAGGIFISTSYGTMQKLDILNCSFDNNKGAVGAVDAGGISRDYYTKQIKVTVSGNTESGNFGSQGCNGMKLRGRCHALSEDFTSTEDYERPCDN